jgi:hypothetical protein
MRLGSMRAERPFPPVIEPGDSTRCWIGLGEVTDIVRVRGTTGKVRLTFEVEDALGHVHKDEMHVDTDEWLPYLAFFSEQIGQREPARELRMLQRYGEAAGRTVHLSTIWT